jgi:hypothetical protein
MAELDVAGADFLSPTCVGPATLDRSGSFLAPSERYYENCVRGHKKLTDWARQLLLQVRRWLPERSGGLSGDTLVPALPPKPEATPVLQIGHPPEIEL